MKHEAQEMKYEAALQEAMKAETKQMMEGFRILQQEIRNLQVHCLINSQLLFLQ